MSKTVSEQVVHSLVEAGITHIYGIVGDSLNSIVNTIENDKAIRWIHVRHEESAAFAACAEAQLTGKIAACCGSCGPGNLHLINGLFDAQRSAAPIFALASHIPSNMIGTDFFQETHPTHIFKDCSHYCELISQAEQISTLTEAALRHAYEQSGVGIIVLPGDIASQKTTSHAHPYKPQTPSSIHAAPEQIERLAQYINESERICLLCGAGCQEAQAELSALSEAIHAPIVYSLRGKEFIENQVSNTIGMTGLLGWGDASQAIKECDLLLLLGSDFPYSVFLPQDGRVIQVDKQAHIIGRRCPVKMGITADIKNLIHDLLPRIKTERKADYLHDSLQRHQKKSEKINQLTQHHTDNEPIRPEYLTHLISQHADTDAIFIVDTGTANIWAARYLKAGSKRRIIGSFKHGSMACGLGMAIGAKIAHPERQVIVLTGDGSLSMLAGEMVTLLQEQLNVKIVVYNNSSLDLVDIEQRIVGMRPSGTQLIDCDYAQIAKSMGIAGERIAKASRIADAIKRCFSSEEASVLDVVVDAHALAMPPEINMGQSIGFAKSLISEIIHGELSTVKRLLYGNRKLWT